jgi:hypothetical protein
MMHLLSEQYRPRIHVSTYRGWRPLRALILILIGIIAGLHISYGQAPPSAVTYGCESR